MRIITGIFSILLNGLVAVAIVAVTMANTIQAQQNEAPQTLTNGYVSREDVECMAKNIYFEARSDNMAGQFAVADVVLNRVKDKRYPNTICDVIYEGPVKEKWKTKQDPNLPAEEREYIPLRHRCQFSWYCDGKGDEPRPTPAWKDSVEIAEYIIRTPSLLDITDGATHYHADWMEKFPKWAHQKKKLVKIDTHIFYKKRNNFNF